MTRTTPQPQPLRQSPRKKPPATAAAVLERAMKQMSEWPNTWQVDEPDLPYGEGLLTEFKPFVTHLITVEQLSASSINRHLGYLLLLGSEPAPAGVHLFDNLHVGGHAAAPSAHRRPIPPTRRSPNFFFSRTRSPLRLWTHEYR